MPFFVFLLEIVWELANFGPEEQKPLQFIPDYEDYGGSSTKLVKISPVSSGKPGVAFRQQKAFVPPPPPTQKSASCSFCKGPMKKAAQCLIPGLTLLFFIAYWFIAIAYYLSE